MHTLYPGYDVYILRLTRLDRSGYNRSSRDLGLLCSSSSAGETPVVECGVS